MAFYLGALVHLLMCIQTNRHTLQLALCLTKYMFYTSSKSV